MSRTKRTRILPLLTQEWREIGGLGRLAVVGIIASALLAIVLGFSIAADARGHLLDARAEILQAITDDLARSFATPFDDVESFDSAVRELLVGGETVRVKLWLPDGTIAYSDDEELVGQVFDLSEPAVEAFSGEMASKVSDLSEPAHAAHRHLGSLIEFYIPFAVEGGSVASVFEIEQRTDKLEAALGRIERSTWLSIGGGLAVLGLFLGALAMARARDLNRRRRQAVEMVGALLSAEERERRRVVGALHDDIGQPLYRLLYGIEGTAARMDESNPLRTELTDMTDLVHQIDSTLRAELRLHHLPLLEDLGFTAALQGLVDGVRSETGLRVDADLAIDTEPADGAARALFRAAAEALTNVRKHADAGLVRLRLRERGGFFVLSVADDGKGGPIVPGLGLATTKERLEILGGSLEVTSARGGGTELTARAPSIVGDP